MFQKKKQELKRRAGFFWFISKDGVVKTVIHGYIYIEKGYEYLFLLYFNRIFPKYKKTLIYGKNLNIRSLQSIFLQFFCAFGHKTQALRSSFSNRKIKTFETFHFGGKLTLNKCHADPPTGGDVHPIAKLHRAFTAVCMVMG